MEAFIIKAIIFTNTVYQLFVAINMRLNGIPQGDADLVISDHTPSLIRYQESLQRSGLFERVYFVNSLQRVKAFWSVPEPQKREAFGQLLGTIRQGAIDFSDYTTLFTANFNPYINGISHLNPQMKVCFYEDGASVCAVDWRKSFRKYSGIPGFMEIFDRVKGLYLHSPELMCVDLGWPMVKLPSINKEDERVRRLYNQIFQFDGSFSFPPFVFVEQSFQVDQVSNNDLAFMEAASEIVGFENFMVKTHPRNTVNRPVEQGICRRVDCVLPFELLLLNAKREGTVFITVSSTSLISPWVLFGERVPTILLYRAVTGGINIPAIDQYQQYLDKFVRQYACRELMVPGSMREYQAMLRLLRDKAENKEAR